jgi:hypothetical protein
VHPYASSLWDRERSAIADAADKIVVEGHEHISAAYSVLTVVTPFLFAEAEGTL